jgi:hypothetical protein
MQELPQLEQLYLRLKGEGLTVVGVALNDTLENINDARRQFGFTFPVLLDARGVSKRAYQLKGFPESFVLDSNHRVMLVEDPEDGGVPVAKIVGPREWGNPQWVAVFERLLRAAKAAQSVEGVGQR